MIKRVLVALSGTPYTHTAIEHAVELARRHDAELTGVTDVDLERLSDTGPVPLGGGGAAHALVEHRIAETRQRIEAVTNEFRVRCRQENIKGRVELETGDAFEQLLSLWRYHDFTIVGFRGLFEYGVLESPDDVIIRLLARGLRPILAVDEKPRPIKRAFIAYDGTMESAKAMKRFVQMRLWPNVDLKVACFSKDDSESLSLLTDATAYCRLHGFDPESESFPESAKSGLLERAHEWKSDLVVMGTSSRSKLARLVWGSTALHVLQHADLPVFLSS